MPTGTNRTLSRRHRRSRRKGPSATRPAAPTPIAVADASVTGQVMTVTFDQAVSLSGVPKYVAIGSGAVPESARAAGPATIELTYAAFVPGGNGALAVPFEDPAVTNPSGGRVNAGQFNVAAASVAAAADGEAMSIADPATAKKAA